MLAEEDQLVEIRFAVSLPSQGDDILRSTSVHPEVPVFLQRFPSQ